MITDPPAYPMACAACPHTRISPAAIVIETRLNSFIAVPPQKTCAAATASGGPSAAVLKGSKSSHLHFALPRQASPASIKNSERAFVAGVHAPTRGYVGSGLNTIDTPIAVLSGKPSAMQIRRNNAR